MRAGRYERLLHRRGYSSIAGVDEAGRGPLAGPVVAAAVILPTGPQPTVWKGVKDSKMLSHRQREKIFPIIQAKAIAWSASVVSNDEIDLRNILNATLLAMSRAVRRLRVPPDYVLVDGNRMFPCEFDSACVVGGDRECLSIAAASILAKVIRDRIMSVYARRFPVYGFERNRGYPTVLHREALARHGPCPIHRRTFRMSRPPQTKLDLG